MAGGQRLVSWLHPCSTSNVARNTRTCAHGPLMGHPNWAGCDNMAFEFKCPHIVLPGRLRWIGSPLHTPNPTPAAAGATHQKSRGRWR
jgi:hypothetical protein